MKGSGNVKTDVRQVSGFSSVKLSGIGSLEIAQTGTEGLSISAEDNLLPLINTNVQGGVLDIHSQPNTNLQPTKPIIYLLSVKDLTAITLSGAGSVTAQQFKTPNLTVDLSGAGDINLTGLQLNSLTVKISGTGNMTVVGTTTNEDVSASGVGDYKGEQLASATAKVRLSGVGSAAVRASQSLDVTISGVGSLTYYGDPTVTQHITGLGKVTHAQG
ncbi:MAG: DUF2807 domain-containing protein [Ktedonobacterales bacterium]|nr:DUF2807 domain-containing protein [Ktedonobacterales bacterium]